MNRVQARWDDEGLRDLYVPGLFLPSLGNHRGHHMALARTKADQRATFKLCLAQHRPLPLPVAVTLTRVAPRALDGHDNITSAFKAIVDEITDWLGLKNDRDPRVAWAYEQRRLRVREVGVWVAFEQKANAAEGSRGARTTSEGTER